MKQKTVNTNKAHLINGLHANVLTAIKFKLKIKWSIKMNRYIVQIESAQVRDILVENFEKVGKGE